MRLNYIHFNCFKPLYVGEGKPGRERKLRRTGIYGGWLKNHSRFHVCILTVGHFSDAVSSQLNEQGLISWLGRGISNEGPLMNVVPYSTASGYGPSQQWREQQRIRMTGRNVTKNTRAKLSKAAQDKEWSEASRKKISEWSKGLERTPTHRERMSGSMRNRPIGSCPHCGKTGRMIGGMLRHHFDNCKHKV